MAVLDNVLNVLLLLAAVAVTAWWIVALIKWDGKCPCKPEDCANCVYSGTGCKTDPKTKRSEKNGFR